MMKMATTRRESKRPNLQLLLLLWQQQYDASTCYIGWGGGVRGSFIVFRFRFSSTTGNEETETICFNVKYVLNRIILCVIIHNAYSYVGYHKIKNTSIKDVLKSENKINIK